MSAAEDHGLITFLGEHFDALAQRFAALERRFAALDRRLDGVERDLAELRAHMLGHFDQIHRRLDRLG